ncbi:MAG TPA: ABC transporter substrate-binding protein, partial [Sphaerochaeta sp.]|nr:ABC transporter substrate-binding protein [Sphaerochaeta sp.]
TLPQGLDGLQIRMALISRRNASSPAFGSKRKSGGASGTNTLSWDYDKKQYFAGAISEEYKSYITFFRKLYAEGLLDPEMAEPIDGDRWTQKLATGKAMASYAYYDQIGGVEANSTIPGFKLQMYPALAGPAGAHHQEKSRTGGGVMFPIKTSRRADFEQLVRAVDEMFFSEENAKLWCLGVEGVTYTVHNGKIVFADEFVNAKEGIYKSMQVKHGTGSDVTQMVWVNAREMTKYDDNYARINAEVEAMGDVIRYIPPTPKFDDKQAEEAGSLQTPLHDAWERWNSAFLTGAKSIDRDWNAYVQEMKNLGIDRFLELYNSNL